MYRLILWLIIGHFLTSLGGCSTSQTRSSDVNKGESEGIIASSLEREDKLQIFRDYCSRIGLDTDPQQRAACILKMDIASNSHRLAAYHNRHDKELKALARKSAEKRLKVFKQQCEDVGFASATAGYADCLLDLEIAFHKAKVVTENNRLIDRLIIDAARPRVNEF